jgi:DUF1680 family protein
MVGVSADEVAVHLYGESVARLKVGATQVTLTQQTRYPWDGRVTLTVGLAGPATFGLALRVPGWCTNATLSINGKAVQHELDRGYYRVRQEWRDGDTITLDLPMAVRALHAHPGVSADVGRVALARGPLIYCAEEVDNTSGLNAMIVTDTAAARTDALPALNGAIAIDLPAQREQWADWEGKLYDAQPPALQDTTVRLVPYHLWDNRQPGQMLVWMRER